MAKESAWSIFFLEDDKSKRLFWNLQHLTRELLLRLRHRLLTRRILRYVEETALLVATVTRDLCDCLPPDPVQPTHLNDGHEIDFTQLQ